MRTNLNSDLLCVNLTDLSDDQFYNAWRMRTDVWLRTITSLPVSGPFLKSRRYTVSAMLLSVASVMILVGHREQNPSP